MRIVADPNIPYVREAFGQLGTVELVPGRQMTAATVRDAELLLVRSVTPVNAALLEGSRVRFVATATIGTDHVDQHYLQRRGIGFASAAGSNANSVAEYVVAALLELAHRHQFRLRHKTLGIVGVGNVGSRVLRYAQALGMQVLANDPPRQRTEHLPDFVSLSQLITEADIITLHVPLTRTGPDPTYHLFTPTRGIIINTARGAVLDNVALLHAPLDGLVLDVWEGEPHILPGLLERADIATPHIAGYSFDGKVNGTRQIYEAACRFLGVQPTWQPALPAPPVPELTVEVEAGEDDEAVLRRIVRSVYDIMADDAAFRRAPQDFDRLRAEYPIRREFFNTVLHLPNASETLRAQCAALGFKLAPTSAASPATPAKSS